MIEFCSLPLFGLVSLTVLQGPYHVVFCFWLPRTDLYFMSLWCMIPPSQSRLFWFDEHPFDANFLWSNLLVYVLITMIPSGSSTGESGESTRVPSGLLRPLHSSLASAWGPPSAFFNSVSRFCVTLPACCRQYVMVCIATANECQNSEFQCSRHDAG